MLSRQLPSRILLQLLWLNPYLCCLNSWICRLPAPSRVTPVLCGWPAALSASLIPPRTLSLLPREIRVGRQTLFPPPPRWPQAEGAPLIRQEFLRKRTPCVQDEETAHGQEHNTIPPNSPISFCFTPSAFRPKRVLSHTWLLQPVPRL